MTGSPRMPEWLAGLKITAGQKTMLADRSLFYLAGHFDRQHFYHFSKKRKPQQTQKNTRDGNVLPNQTCWSTNT